MKILVLNSGSSSIKFKFFDMNTMEVLSSGLIEEIGTEHSKAKINTQKTNKKIEEIEPIKNHHEGIETMNRLLQETGAIKNLDDIDGVGHRVVQGADIFKSSVLITDEVIKTIDELSPLAPLHNPAHLAGIRESLRNRPNLPNVAVFDTVFHQSMPKSSYMYALPYEYYEKWKIRRYGAHGTSHEYVSQKAAEILNLDYDSFNAITLHIGNGSSMCAIKNGKCLDTSMGMTPLEGLIMGTRCGDIDPAIIPYIRRELGFNALEIDVIMNKKSGLLGICGTNDMRKIIERKNNNDEKATLAYDMLIHRIKKYIGSYYAILGRVDAVIFTAGIGENSPTLRQSTCEGLEHLGLEIDKERNFDSQTIISKEKSQIKIMKIPTNEELKIALDTLNIIKSL